jgi:hypothetical protein
VKGEVLSGAMQLAQTAGEGEDLRFRGKADARYRGTWQPWHQFPDTGVGIEQNGIQQCGIQQSCIQQCGIGWILERGGKVFVEICERF